MRYAFQNVKKVVSEDETAGETAFATAVYPSPASALPLAQVYLGDVNYLPHLGAASLLTVTVLCTALTILRLHLNQY